ncbi:hypothetical protein H0O02_00540 [Candidatus Micrarchaeota archaeon]|nr:hypothetical protein [Candidatus Micrarchaeota archaeon]
MVEHISSVLEQMLSRLEIRDVKGLYGHEETIAGNLKRLKEAMLNIGHLVDPIIVDGKTGVVLDGNHRLKVLDIIECPNVVCQIVDYQSPEIEVGTWYPTVAKTLDQLLKLDSIKHEKVDCEAGKEAVQNLRAPFMAMTPDGNCHLLNPGSYKMREMIEEQSYIMTLLEKNEIDYIPDEEIKELLGLNRTVLYRRAYNKNEIVKAAQAHTPFPPKSTRHIIPGRIIRLNMKLGWLHMDRNSAAAELKEMLSKRTYAGNVRKYYEPVIVIY